MTSFIEIGVSAAELKLHRLHFGAKKWSQKTAKQALQIFILCQLDFDASAFERDNNTIM